MLNGWDEKFEAMVLETVEGPLLVWESFGVSSGEVQVSRFLFMSGGRVMGMLHQSVVKREVSMKAGRFTGRSTFLCYGHELWEVTAHFC